MSLIKFIRRLEYVNFLIKRKATGDLATFSRKNSLSKRAMTDFLQQMKDLGADIKYDRKQRTYYYEKNGEMTKCVFMQYGEVLSMDEAAKICKAEDLCFSENSIFVPCKDV